MAWLPIANAPPQYHYQGEPASGHVLKFYSAGTTTPILLATTNTGSTTVTDAPLNAEGFPEVSGTVIIPHLEESYKIALYPSQATADANSGFLWAIDNLTPPVNSVNAVDEKVLVSSNDTTAATLDTKVVSGTNITVTEENDGANESLSVNLDDDVTLAGDLTVAGNLKLSKGVDIASATALTIGTDGNYFDVTGTTTITSINTVGVGTVIKLHFDAALTLTHHATDLVLPDAANITTAAGDEAEFVEYATGDWRMVNFTSLSRIRTLSSDPATPTAGQAWVNTTDDEAKIHIAGITHVIAPPRWGYALQVGSATSVTSASSVAVASHSKEIIAVGDGNADTIRAYRNRGGTWSAIGSATSITNSAGWYLSAHNATDLAVLVAGNGNFGMYRLNGSFVYAIVGSNITISSVRGIASATTTDVAVTRTSGSDSIVGMYRHDGTNYALTGNELTISSKFADGMIALNATTFVIVFQSDEIMVLEWDGADFAQVGNTFDLTTIDRLTAPGSHSLAHMGGNNFAYSDFVNNCLILLTFDGTDVTKLSTAEPTQNYSPATRPAITGVSATDLVQFFEGSDVIATYRFAQYHGSSPHWPS